MALSTISGTTGITDATITSAKLADFAAAVDLNGVELILDADQDTSITADTDDRIDFKIANVEHFSFSNSSGDTIVKPMVDAKDIKFQQFDGRTLLDINDAGFVGIENGATGPGAIRIFEDSDLGSNYVGLSVGNVSTAYTLVFPNADGSSGQALTTNGSGVLSFTTLSANTPSSADGQALGSASLEWSDLFLADASTIQFGNDQDVVLTHVADTGLLLSGTNVIQFNDASQNIGAPSATVLDINATDEIELNATLVDINANVEISGTATTTGVHTFTATPVFSSDITVTDDINLISDSAQMTFGANNEITLTHVHDSGLALKHTATADDKPITLVLQTGETDMAQDDVIGAINFQAPDEGTGTDAILVAAGIEAVAEGDFSSSNNATKLSFKTAASEAAAEKMSLSSAGILTVADDIIIGDGKTIGSASDPDAITIASGGGVTFTQTPVFPDGSIAVADLDIDGATDIGAAIVDADLFIVDDGAGGTNRKVTASRLKTYAGGAATIGALTDVSMDITNFTDGILIQTNTDGSAPTTGTLSDAIGNVGIGKDVFKAITSADYAVGIGYEALDVHESGSYPIAIGAFALSSSTTSDSIAIGGSALNACDTEQDNLAIGFHAMKLANSGAEDNTVVGNYAGDAITSGDTNTLVGHHTGGAITTGGDNTVIGGGNYGTLTTGSNNYCLGKGCDVSASGAAQQIAIGKNITVSANDQFRFGNGSSDAVYNQFATNASWTRASDERIKKEIKTNEDCGLDFINDLRTVTFKKRAPSELPEHFKDYDSDNNEPKHKEKLYGMIAQEVKVSLDKHGITDFGGWHEDEVTGQQGISQEMFVYPLIKAVQELSAENKNLKERLTTLENK